MPKKTKKQKLLAELRRKLTKAETLPPVPDIRKANLVKRLNDGFPQSAPASVSIFLEHQQNIVVKPKTTTSIVDYSHVKHDLIKITIFSLIAFIFQGVLYFVLRRS